MSAPEEVHSQSHEPAAAAEDSVRLPGADAASPASIDKVRDILFGNHMRDVERRFARLEDRLIKETASLKEDMRRRLDTLEAYMRRETESLEGLIKSERGDRVDSHAGLSNELKEASRAIDRRATAIDEQHSKGQREIRQQLLEQHQRLSDDLQQKVDEILATLSRTAQELRTDKADRATIASLLTEVAMRLTDEFRLPGAEDLGNG